jgi:hypothetical protein
MSASLAYFDSYRRARLLANLVQAQQDYFGAHTYERTNVEGSFHTKWFKLANSLRFKFCWYFTYSELVIILIISAQDSAGQS